MSGTRMRYKAKWESKPQESDELHFLAGDIIEAPAKTASANWGSGMNVRTGAQGTFPWNLLEDSGTPVDQLTTSHSYQNFVPTAVSNGAAPPIPSRSSMLVGSRGERRTSSATSRSDAGTSSAEFTNEPWFGGKMKKNEVTAVLQNAPDGTFLIRDSTSRAGFSLSVKFSEIRHIVILYRGNKFGFSEPTTFESIPALVEYFQKESLAHYNAELETRLEYPFKTAPKSPVKAAPALPEEDEEEIYQANRQQLRNQLGGGKAIGRHDDDAIYMQMKSVELEQKAQTQMLSMLKDQKKLQERLLETSQFQADDESKLQKNLTLLKRRIVDSERTVNLIEGQVQEVRSSLDHRALSMSGSTRKTKLIVDEKIDRERAEAILEGKEDGTYLIRKSNRSNDPYSLSMRFEGKTRHIQIKYDGTRYGFAEPLAFFSLEDLCKFYTETELSSTITRTLSAMLNKTD